jgi:predicted GNAT family acetyltransferase
MSGENVGREREDAMNQESAAVRDNPAMSRFELELDGSLAFAEYALKDGVMTFTHTESPPALQGRGAASKLIHGALLAARARGLKVRATCSFVAAYLKRHREFADLED